MSSAQQIKDIARQRSERIETIPIDIEGIDAIRVRRLKAARILELAKLPDDDSGAAMVGCMTAYAAFCGGRGHHQ